MIAENLKTIRKELGERATLVCVSKFHPNEAIMEAYNAGERRFGENRPQEMLEKATTLPHDIEWHFIGNLQTNKVKIVVPYASIIHSMSNDRLVDEIEKQAAKINKVQDVLIELHVAQEESKQGFSPQEAISLFTPEYIDRHPHIRICGVMGMATNTENETVIRRDFQEIRDTFETLKKGAFANSDHFREISMGMSGDWRLAVEMGSTIVRIGSSIFGARQY